ncbi:flagellin N-terminal helical domain-containing protein [Bacillus massiliigorillae]|uniref:flagellin N-terminal helical domain-containing protein n=1 Tax=Bacillus massiliigorillae TaxID=1243664 RepID=UPI0003A2BF48|nr:flagellin [Bacillus massiliigorillae]
MRINHNISALNTYRQMGANQSAASKNMEKLSSGLRINRAGDDAAGLAISEKMRGQIRGLDMASKNSQDGISMIQTAEGALNETHSILQRMRELANQAANDTNVGVDRGEIQKEINQLTSEINRVGNTTEFNTQSLLKGNGGVKLEGIGAGAASLGALTNGAERTTTEAAVTLTVGTAASAADTVAVTINGQTLTATFRANGTANQASHEGYNIASGGNNTTADINIDASQTTGETADALRDTFQKMIDSNDELKGNYVVSGTGNDLTITAVKGGKYEGSAGTVSAFTAAAVSVGGGSVGAAATGTTTAATQANRTITMPTVANADDAAALIGKGMTINGKSIEFYDANKGVYTGSAQGINIGGLTTTTAIVDAIVSQAKIDGVTLSNDAGNLKVSASQGGVAGNKIVVADGGVQKDFQATFQVGANKGQSMTIQIGDMRSAALGLTGKAGDEGFTTTDVVNDGTNNTAKEAALDVSNHEKASSAIKVINDAIEQVSAQRSNLGAFQNRLEHTINNLGTSSENLTAAESRIRDVDMAKEMMEQTKNNILQQAAQAMLAQANQQPQGVLQLLR